MPSRNPVLLIHGFLDTSKLFRKMAPYLEEAGYEVHCLDLIPNHGASGLDALARQLESFIAGHFPQDRKVDIVGFSMGGIVSRYYIQRLGGIDRVRRFITIGSPHRGTWTAWALGSKGVRQMRPGSDFLRDLNGDCAVLDRLGFTSIWTPFDLMIVPASSSSLPVGKSIRVNVAAHPLMVTDGRVLKLVRQILDQPVSPRSA